MSRIGARFAALRAERRAGLVVYLTAGDPDLDATVALARAALDAGADLLELGVPFSDPTADGPDIRRAMARSLAAGTTLGGVLGAVAAVRSADDAPIVLFGYANPFFVYGFERLARDAARAGADGVLAVDLPPEEAADLRAALAAEGLDAISMVAPTSTPARVEQAARAGSGFVYCVARLGTTGAPLGDLGEIEPRLRDLRGRVALPLVVGFGVAEPELARRLAPLCDAVVVGSALVRIVERRGSGAAGEIAATVAALAAAIRAA